MADGPRMCVIVQERIFCFPVAIQIGCRYLTYYAGSFDLKIGYSKIKNRLHSVI